MTADVPDRLDARLSLLDRQIVDRADRPVAKVDDLELSIDYDGRPTYRHSCVDPAPALLACGTSWILHPHRNPDEVKAASGENEAN